MQEDMWLTHKLDANTLTTLFDIVKRNNINNLKIHQQVPYWEYEILLDKLSTNAFKYELFKLDQSSRWLMSHQASIWDRKFILPFINENEDALSNELRTTDKLRNAKEDINFYIYSHNWYLQPVGAVSGGKLTETGENYLIILQHEKYLNELIRRKKVGGIFKTTNEA